MHPNHQPFSFTTNNTIHTVLYIHGIMGSPIEFRQLVDHAEFPKVNYKAILLPGHGGSGKQFGKYKAQDWQEQVFNEIEYHYQNNIVLILIGHSLGGLLTLQAAAKYPVAGMILINTALRTRFTIRQMQLSLRVLFSSKDNLDPIISTYRKTFSICTKDWWTIPLWILRLIDVMQIANQTEKLLPQVKSNIHIFQSVKDETVDPISAEIMRNSLVNSTVKLTYLQNSIHAHFEENDLMLLVGGIREMVNELESLKVVN